jgi:putative transposase
MVDFVRTCFRVSIRRACKAIPVRRSTYHYRSRRPEQAALRKRIREIAETRTRYGYRRIHVLLRREGWPINAKRVYRLYKLEKLQMRHKPPRRRVSAKLREDRRPATAPNECWSMDWMYDELFDGRRIWVLTIVDNFSRVSPGLWAGRQAKATDVVNALGSAVAEFGCPQRIRLDNGSQFTSKEMDLWAYANDVVLDFSRPGKPTDNAYSEAFNSRFRLECLNQHWFLDIEDARAKIEAWRQDYNTVRPHGAIGNQVPMALVRSEMGRISHTSSGPDNR